MAGWDRRHWPKITAIIAGFSLGQTALLSGADPGLGRQNSPDAISRMNCGAQIECVTPDGQFGRISRLPVRDPRAAALIMKVDTVTCVLQEGETNFVIELPDVA